MAYIRHDLCIKYDLELSYIILFKIQLEASFEISTDHKFKIILNLLKLFQFNNNFSVLVMSYICPCF